MSEYFSEPLQDVEAKRKRIGESLGDPTLFPVEFLNWLKRFIESSGINLPASAIYGGFKPGEGGSGAGSLKNVAPGIIVPCGGANPPEGSVPCNGASYLRTELPALFGAIGTTWGSADATHFNVPDLRDRALYGAGTTVGMGATDGGALGTRGPRHSHSFSGQTNDGGSHSHGGSTNNTGAHQHGSDDPYAFLTSSGNITPMGTTGPNRYLATGNPTLTSSNGDHSHSITTDSQGNHSHGFSGRTSGGGLDNAPGYAGVLYVITTGQ